MSAIIYASIIAAVVMAAAFNRLGVRWCWAFLISSIIAGGLGWSAADAIGLL